MLRGSATTNWPGSVCTQPCTQYIYLYIQWSIQPSTNTVMSEAINVTKCSHKWEEYCCFFLLKRRFAALCGIKILSCNYSLPYLNIYLTLSSTVHTVSVIYFSLGMCPFTQNTEEDWSKKETKHQSIHSEKQSIHSEKLNTKISLSFFADPAPLPKIPCTVNRLVLLFFANLKTKQKTGLQRAAVLG